MTQVFEKKGLTKKSENISEWYHDVVLRAELANYSEVKGSMIIRPYGYAIWEHVQKTLDEWFKEDGVQNAYFPLLIPMSYLQKEKDHLKGFSPELAIVTHAGGEELAEPYAIRPTSETIMYKTFSDWIQSYRDLPLKINQWANVVRWEKRTYPFLRTSEFLWQEGHTVHQTEAEAIEMTLKALKWYKKFYEEQFAISVYAGIKSESEKFAGAKTTYSIEMVIPDGKALQAATSHNLSDNFAKVFDIEFLNEEGKKEHPFQTSWGLSTRSIGGLILSHGDDSGLIVPPRVAPHQVVILIVGGDATVKDHAMKISHQLRQRGVRIAVDIDSEHSLGFRINNWELKGVPVRLEVGAKEIEQGTVKFVRRDTFEKGFIPLDELEAKIPELLEAIQNELFEKSKKNRDNLTINVDSLDLFKESLEKQRYFIRAPWCEDAECEAKIKEETKVSTRVLELERTEEAIDGACVGCGGPAKRRWLFAQGY
ncbi:MAG: proline--tRNA ligase [Patescibacteria group bacterium]